MPFGVSIRDFGWTRESCIRWGSRSANAKGQFLNNEHDIVWICSTTLCRELRKMAEPIEMPYGLWTRVDCGLGWAQLSKH